MPPRACQLVASLLIAQQVCCGVLGGKVWCVPLWGCECPDTTGQSASRHHGGDHEHEPIGDHHHDHDHDCPWHDHDSPATHAVSDARDCGCHIHVPVPAGKESAPSPEARATTGDLFGALALVAVLEWKPAPAPAVMLSGRPPGWGERWGGTAAGLRSTRLII